MKTISIEVSMTFPRPAYTTEGDYDVEVSEKDYLALLQAEDWDEVPGGVYNRIYKRALRVIREELVDNGDLDRGDDPEDFCEFDLTFPELEEKYAKRKEKLLKKARVGISQISAGPGSGVVVGEVYAVDGTGKARYYSIADVDGIANCMITKVSTYKAQISGEESDELSEILGEGTIDTYSDFSDIYEAAYNAETEDEEDEDADPDLDVWHYLAYIIREADEEKIKAFIGETVGKHFSEFTIPRCEDEEDYLIESGYLEEE